MFIFTIFPKVTYKGIKLTTKHILEELKHLTIPERLLIAEKALHLIHKDIEKSKTSQSNSDSKKQLTSAAELLVSDYLTDAELTSFTALDSEDFRA
jgi:hypothetical protein